MTSLIGRQGELHSDLAQLVHAFRLNYVHACVYLQRVELLRTLVSVQAIFLSDLTYMIIPLVA